MISSSIASNLNSSLKISWTCRALHGLQAPDILVQLLDRIRMALLARDLVVIPDRLHVGFQVLDLLIQVLESLQLQLFARDRAVLCRPLPPPEGL